MHKSKINLPLVAILIGLSISTFFLTNNSLTPSRSSEAAAPDSCNCDDSDVCYPDGCSRKPKTTNNTYDDARYDSVCKQYDPGYEMPEPYFRYYCGERQPDCCFDVYKYKESRFCCWQERYTCHPKLCEGSSGGTGCGHYWGPGETPEGTYLSERPEGYGCVIGDHNNLQAKYGVPPNLPSAPTSTTAPQQPTAIPTRTPTPRPNQPSATNTPTLAPGQPTLTMTPTLAPGQPTLTPAPGNPTSGQTEPTQTANQQPTGSSVFQFPTKAPQVINGTPQPTNKPFSVGLPKFPDLSIKKNIDIVKVEQDTGKTLGFFEYTFNGLRRYDLLLETTVNDWFSRLWQRFSQ